MSARWSQRGESVRRDNGPHDDKNQGGIKARKENKRRKETEKHSKLHSCPLLAAPWSAVTCQELSPLEQSPVSGTLQRMGTAPWSTKLSVTSHADPWLKRLAGDGAVPPYPALRAARVISPVVYAQ